MAVARLAHVSEELTKDILIALLELPSHHPAARAAEIHSWTLPGNYQPVHELFLDFRLGPYADLPVTFGDLIKRYGGAMLVGGIAAIALLLASLSMMMRVNRQLSQSRKQLQLAAGVFDHAQEGIIIADTRGRIIEANDSFIDLTGYARPEVIGRSPRFLASGQQDKGFYRGLMNALLEKNFWRGELGCRRKDGCLCVLQTSISTVRGDDGRVSHFIGLASDITDLKEGQTKLEKMAFYGALKIDQSFIRDMLDDPEDLAIVDGIVGLASAFRREVIAEGVETPAHGRMLLQLGCDMAQGYGIARPMPAERLPDWIASWRPPEEWRAVRAWPREDLPLLTVEIDHLRWVRQFAAALQDKDGAANRWPQLDHQECRFGLWLKGSGKAKYGRLAAFDRMAEAHAEVHAVGAAIVRDHQADPAAARERMHEIHACRDRLLARLAELRSAAGLPAG